MARGLERGPERITPTTGGRQQETSSERPATPAASRGPPPLPLPTAELSQSERLACLRLVRTDGIGPASFRSLVNTFGGAQAAIDALPDLARRAGRRRPLIVPPPAVVEDELANAQHIGAAPIFTIEPGYPLALAALDQPPPMIYALGARDLLNQPSVAIVGSREASAAGTALAGMFAKDLASQSFIVVSGLARGIDAAAHAGAGASASIAVVAGGVDVIYPPENRMLHEALAAEGCIVSDQPPGFRPRGKDFPRRNRIISGLSLGIVIVEAAARSGSLITARLASEHGREVFAVPGHPLDPRAYGTNALLKQGATLVTDAADVVEVLRPMISAPRMAEPSSARDTLRPWCTLDGVSHDIAIAPRVRSRIVSALGPVPVSIDTLVRAAECDIREVQITLLELTLADRLEHHAGGLVSLKPQRS
ncbi:MAG: DNA-processing protein DprA [Hyphomicrobiaceae bacterium]